MIMVGRPRLVAVGHVLIDLRFMVDRFPEPDEEAVILSESRGVGGSAANVAIAARRLGVESYVIAKIGLDSFARVAVDNLLKEKVDISGLRISPTHPTGFSVVVRDSQGRILIYGFKGAAEKLEPGEIDPSILGKADYIHIASLKLSTTLHVVKTARSLGVKISWDPGRVLASKGLRELGDIVRKVDIVLANEREARLMTGEADYRSAASRIIGLGPMLVIIKRGEKGVYAVGRSMELEIPAYPPEKVVDTTGAGDTFAAGLLSSIMRGYSLEDSIRYAAVAAAIKVSRLGSHAAPTDREVEEYMARHGIKIGSSPRL